MVTGNEYIFDNIYEALNYVLETEQRALKQDAHMQAPAMVMRPLPVMFSLPFTEEIVGWNIGPTLDTDCPMADLRMALNRIGGQDVSLIHHSDRGCQYASRVYTDTLRSHGIRISMTESGDPKDNAQAERINNTMKKEMLKDKVLTSMEEVIAVVAVAVDFYNNRRPHMSIGKMKPSETINLTGERNMKWTSYRQRAIKNSNNTTKTEYHLPENPCQGFPFGLRPTVNP